MMELSGWAVATSLVLGSVRAVQLFRASANAGAVNAVVLTTLASGRSHDLEKVFARSGSGLYLNVARSICEPVDKLSIPDATELRRRLERDAQAGLMEANRTLKRFSWLESMALGAIVLAGVGAATATSVTAPLALGLFAATLLWLSNLYATRNIATRMFAGGMALVDGLVAGREEIRGANAEGF